MAGKLMLQGTMSNVGKTLLTAGLCRIFRQEGYRVMPFKAQNMSLNSCITADGLEMASAQVIQAEAAGVAPSADMNPLLLKPTGLKGSQVILQGHVLENMTAAEFYRRKAEFRKPILESFHRLEEQADILLIEGAGSPAELNLRRDDLVNMGFAEMVDAPVLLVGDIDPGGVFAQLLGTLSLFTPEERRRVRGLIVNKFRGDPDLFRDGIRILEEKSGLPVVGVVPFMELCLPDEDSMSGRLRSGKREGSVFDLAVIRYPRISNFTDFDCFDAWKDMNVRYVTSPEELGWPDLLILPGSKNTSADMNWLRAVKLDQAVRAYSRKGTILGICGGFQMLGEEILDPLGMEEGGSCRGLGLLPVSTTLITSKVQKRREDRIGNLTGPLRELSGCRVSGYEIHMGQTSVTDRPAREEAGVIGDRGEYGENGECRETGEYGEDGECRETGECGRQLDILFERGNIYGTYLHGFFDAEEVIPRLRKSLAGERGISPGVEEGIVRKAFLDREYDRLAEMLRRSLDLDLIRKTLGI